MYSYDRLAHQKITILRVFTDIFQCNLNFASIVLSGTKTVIRRHRSIRKKGIDAYKGIDLFLLIKGKLTCNKQKLCNKCGRKEFYATHKKNYTKPTIVAYRIHSFSLKIIIAINTSLAKTWTASSALLFTLRGLSLCLPL